MKRLLVLLLACISVLGVPANAENSDWILETHDEDKNIKVFTREVAGSPLKEFKGITYVNTDMNVLVALLKDADGATQWMHNTVKFEVKENISEVESIVYSVSEAPWPVTNRDSYVRSMFNVDKSGVVTSTIEALPNYGPVSEDYVRMPELKGGWVFSPIEEGKVEVVYQVHANPGGSLPDWLVNSIVVETPLETLSNLHEQIKLEKYQNQSFSFISNL